MPSKTGVTIYADEAFVDRFDDRVWELKNQGKIDRDASRSEVIRELMEGLVTGNLQSRPGLTTILS